MIYFILTLIFVLIVVCIVDFREDEQLFKDTNDNGNDNDEYYMGVSEDD